MPVTKQWPSGTVNATPTSYQLPLNNELNWLQLSSFLQSLADSAQGTTFQKMRVRTVTATPDTVNATVDCILPINVASASAINLPAGLEKQVFFIFDASGAAATNNITITPNGAETVRGAASLVLNKNYQGVILAFTGTDWKAFGPFITPGSVTDADFSGVLTTAKGGTGQNSTATFPGSGVVATVPAAGVVKSNGTVLSSSNVDLTSEVTGTLPNGNTTATSANTASAIVARDGSGNFSAGTITASLSGNATTATSATTAGNVSGVVAIANGGSGQTTANAALNAFLPNQATNAGKVLQTDGTNTSWASVLANGSTLLAADGLVGTPGIAFNADQDTGFYRIGANNLGFAANGVKVGEFGTTGWTLGDTALAASTFKVDSGGNTTFIISAPTGSTSALQFNINNTRQNSIEVTNTADFNFRNNASNVTFSVANGGACTFGLSTTSGNHVFYGTTANIRINSATNNDSQLYFQENSSNKWLLQNNQATDNLEWYAGGSTLVASLTQAGSATFGPANTNNYHTFNVDTSSRKVILAPGSASPAIILDQGGTGGACALNAGSSNTILSFNQSDFYINTAAAGNITSPTNAGSSGGTPLFRITGTGACSLGPTTGTQQTHTSNGVLSITSIAALASSSTIDLIVRDSGTQKAQVGAYKNGSSASNGFLGFDEQGGGRQYLWSNAGIWYTSANSANIGNAAGTVVGDQTSDERLKEKIKPIEYGLSQVLKLVPIDFVMGGKKKIGFGAQTTRLIVPEAVYDTGEKIFDDEYNKLAMDYTAIIPVLVKAIQELKGLIDAIQV